MSGQRSMIGAAQYPLTGDEGRIEHSDFRWTYFSQPSDGPYRTRAVQFFKNVDWESLLQYAVKIRNGTTGTILPPIGLGGNHMVRIIEFSDGIRWVARLRMPSLDGEPYSPSILRMMQSEACTMTLIRQKSTIPVPRVHACEVSHPFIVGAPFMLLDCLEGNVAVDLNPDVPTQNKGSFFKELAKIHVALSTVQLPKIGTLVSVDGDGTIVQGPIPGLGGPFSTATEFFQAWATKTKFPVSEERLRAASGAFADEVVHSVSAFPKSVEELANRLSSNEYGPFPLRHGDFGLHNIVVDNHYRILGIIDWEFAYAAPWEMAGSFPIVLRVIPPAMNPPWLYDEFGNPKDVELAEKFAERQRYIEALKEEEIKLSLESNACISSVLKKSERQNVIDAMEFYEGGKSGLYSGVIDAFTLSR